MKRSTDRILTTHTGSLPRPPDLLEVMRTREAGEPYDRRAFDDRVRSVVAAVVRLQAESGVDVVSDGEIGKPSFVMYVHNRLRGMEGLNPAATMNIFPDFPDYLAWRAGHRGSSPPLMPEGVGWPECVGPLGWKDKAALQSEIDDFRAALQGVSVEEAFLPAASIGIIAQRIKNQYYPTYEEYAYAIADVMKDEYRAIVDAGFLLQIDAPEMVMDKNSPEFIDRPLEEYRKRMTLWVDALNTALSGIPEDKIRFHICWGNREGPHTLDVPLKDIVDVMLRVNAGAYSVEACNPRHAHEWRVWQDTKLPEGKVLIPGVLDSTTNFVEHPELVADRILTYAKLVGRENVIAGTDCGFATTAFGTYLVYPPIVWAKLKAMAEGARLASGALGYRG